MSKEKLRTLLDDRISLLDAALVKHKLYIDMHDLTASFLLVVLRVMQRLGPRRFSVVKWMIVNITDPSEVKFCSCDFFKVHVHVGP